MKDTSTVIDQVFPTLQALEADRQNYLAKRKTWLLAVVAPVMGAAILATIFFFPFGFFGFVLGLIVCGIAYHFMAGTQKTAFVNSYKQTVIERLVKLVDENLHYDHSRGIDQSYFINSELFTTRPDRYSTEDLIYGHYGKTNLVLGELHAEDRRTSTDSEGRTKTTYVTIFKGLLLIADFHKHFQGRTFVFPDFAEKTFGGSGRAFQKLGGRSGTDLVQLEDTEFEEAFAVHTTDQIEARYILSPAMLRRILDLKHKFGKDVRIAFKDSSVWIAVPHTSSFLEPKTNVVATDRSQVEQILGELSTFLELIEELDLNTRIWTKE